MTPEAARERCWLEVDLDVLEHNYRSAKEICGEGVQIIPVLKANAYGLGAAKLSRTLAALGATLFAVAEPGEAREVRRACGKDALVLGWIGDGQMERAVREALILTAYSPEQARCLDAAAAQAGGTARVHVKLDTGLHRLGFDPGDPEAILAACRLPHLRVEGVFTHLALREDAADAQQLARLNEIVARLRAEGIDPGLVHALDSIGMVRHPGARLDAVRIGAWLYGVTPSRYPNASGECRLPVRLMARVSQVRSVQKGEYLGYDEEHPLTSDRIVATLSAGYADGYPRVNNTGEVLVHGRRAPVAGLVCMDQMTVDVTDIPGMREGDAVTLLGGGIPLEELSAASGRHRNDLLSGIGRRVPRIYLRGGIPEEVAADANLE